MLTIVIDVAAGLAGTYPEPMRLSKDESERNRWKILATAGRLFRARGFDGAGVDALMAAAGFSHGGFYNHFVSKEELEAEASGAAIADANAAMARSLEAPGGWDRYLRDYLSPSHRDDREGGCTLGALAADASRKGPRVQRRFAEAVEEVAGLIAKDLARKDRKERPASRRARSLQILSRMVGALVLSRAVAAADPRLSAELLAVNRRKLG